MREIKKNNINLRINHIIYGQTALINNLFMEDNMENNNSGKAISDLIAHLNIILRNELVAINQYFLHYKIMQDQGFLKLAAVNRAESIDEMKHAEVIMDRILFLKGAPNMTDYKPLKIATTVESMLQSDLQLEIEAIADLKKAIAAAANATDSTTKTLLETILASEENHFSFLETQLDLIKKLGLQNYLTMQI